MREMIGFIEVPAEHAFEAATRYLCDMDEKLAARKKPAIEAKKKELDICGK